MASASAASEPTKDKWLMLNSEAEVRRAPIVMPPSPPPALRPPKETGALLEVEFRADRLCRAPGETTPRRSAPRGLSTAAPSLGPEPVLLQAPALSSPRKGVQASGDRGAGGRRRSADSPASLMLEAPRLSISAIPPLKMPASGDAAALRMNDLFGLPDILFERAFYFRVLSFSLFLAKSAHATRRR